MSLVAPQRAVADEYNSPTPTPTSDTIYVDPKTGRKGHFAGYVGTNEGAEDEYDTRARPGSKPSPYVPPVKAKPVNPGTPFSGFTNLTPNAGPITRPELRRIPPERGLDGGLPSIPGVPAGSAAPPPFVEGGIPQPKFTNVPGGVVPPGTYYPAPGTASGPYMPYVPPHSVPYGAPSTVGQRRGRFPPGQQGPEYVVDPTQPYSRPYEGVVSPPSVSPPSIEQPSNAQPRMIVTPAPDARPYVRPAPLVDEYGRPATGPVPALPESLPPPLGPLGRSITVVRSNKARLTIQGGYSVPSEEPKGLVSLGGPLANYTWSALDYDGRFGGRIGLLVRNGASSRIEGRFAYLGRFDDDNRQSGTLSYRDVPGGALTTTPLATAQVSREMDVFHGEISYRPRLSSSRTVDVDGILGVRGIFVNESGSVSDFSIPLDAGFVGTPNLDVDSSTTFFGGQAGIGAEFKLSRTVSIDVGFKGFAGLAWREIDSTQRSIVASGTSKADDDDSVFAWGGEIDVGLRIPLSDSVQANVGYSLLYLDGVVDLNDALDWSNTAGGSIPVSLGDESLLTHSFFIGLSFDF